MRQLKRMPLAVAKMPIAVSNQIEPPAAPPVALPRMRIGKLCISVQAATPAELISRADAAGLVLMTTDKDHVRLGGDAALAKLAARASVLPVRLAVDEQDQFRQLVLSAVGQT